MYIADDEDRYTETYKNADLVFQGVPTELFESQKDPFGNNVYRFSVEKIWKGQADARMEIETPFDSATCGVSFKLDTRYIIFARKQENGEYWTGLCSNNEKLTEAVELVDWLNFYREEDAEEQSSQSSAQSSLSNSSASSQLDCSPYVCEDGSEFPRCDETFNHAIHYVVDPCAFSGKEEESDTFHDVPDTHPNATAIGFVRNEGIVQGYADKSYKPNAQINRAEFTKIIVEAVFTRAEINACEQEELFTDVSKEDWFYHYICMAVRHGILDGYPDGTFRPGNFVNFAEASKIVVNAFNIRIDSAYQSGVWWRKYVLTLAGLGGLPTSFTDPNQKLTRGDMAEIIYRVMMGMN